MNEVAVAGSRLPMNSTEVRAHVALVQEVMESVMKKDTHYGTVPGCDKPSLWQPGAEKLCVTFRIAPQFRIEDLSTPDCIRYRVICTGVHQMTGLALGEGVGECSSLEEKYKWRKASQREWGDTDESRRRIKYGYNNRERREYEIFQVRTEPADLANTVLKMAAKRAKVSMVLTVTAASDIFVQDLEDYADLRNIGIDQDSDEAGATQAQPRMPQSRSAAPPAQAAERTVAPPPAQKKSAAATAGNADAVTAGELAYIRRKIKDAGMAEDDVCTQYGIAGSLEAMTKAQFAQAKGDLLGAGR